ncbi:class I SAM-dependent methyltransferase [Gemelliphila palaticanis]|uniref:SAM-dependent methyltransferase n=1 Tax=Gemelliphila palaticanis TaxID=81950 RepID=A0ABX2SYL1_9BACL|nr:SAM-dependent methyltransferase [Gemella palaticanis]MBF0715491.1 SAM-dependent methyltransferase [Gemella palaticanis]NYS47421.1 SAM-dependent methyltransferase [Gemella palaticanis]
MKYKLIQEIFENTQKKELVKINFSNFRNKEQELEKVIAKPILLKEKLTLQFEYRYKRIINHININVDNKDELINNLNSLFLDSKDINITTTSEIINVKISKKHKYLVNRKKQQSKIILSGQNKRKNYVLEEDTIYPFLIELGIQSKSGKIINSKYNKFRQINKYLEFISDAIKKIDNKNRIKILDFGSGKSYLTFSAYHYLKNILNIDVEIIGIDLKKEVIDNCNSIAKKLNFEHLKFVYGDVANFNTNDNIDMVISLHACNTATDIALIKAINWDSKVILAVPCCQKELNNQLDSDFLPFMLKHGIVKEKFATLLTDSIRSQVLEAFGYKSDIIEFISESNTPKNMLIRGFKQEFNKNKELFIKTKQQLQNMNLEMYLINELEKNI